MRIERICRDAAALLSVLVLFAVSVVSAHAAATDTVVVAKIDGVINPVSAEYLDNALKRAADERAGALVIMLDTPGGLDASMRTMVKAITSSDVPVITYVAPAGARAAFRPFLPARLLM